MICPRCCKNTNGGYAHTCTPSDGWRKLEAELAAAQLREKTLMALIPRRTPGGFVSFGKNYAEAEDQFNDPFNKMCKFKRVYLNQCQEALSTPADTSALDAYVAESREAAYREARKAADQLEKGLTRQRDLAVEALEAIAGRRIFIDNLASNVDIAVMTLDIIKESEAK